MRVEDAGRYFDDFAVGRTFATEGYTFTEADMIEFALKYDPQHFHMDRERAATGMYGGIIASGFHTLAIAFRLLVQARVFWPGNIGGKGMDRVRWIRAVHPGDTVRATCEVLELLPSSRADRGNMRLGVVLSNQRDETVLTCELLPVMARRPA